MENLKSQNVISNFKKENAYGGRRKLPTVFTEQGIAMLSGLLENEIAVQVKSYSIIIDIIKKARRKITIY